MRRSLRIACLVVCLVGGWASSASASTTIDYRGTFVGTSEANGSTYSGTTTITSEDCLAGTFTAVLMGNGHTSHFSGTINGSNVTSHQVYDDVPYTADTVGTLSLDGQGRLKDVGTFTDSNMASGSYDTTRISGPPSPPPPGCAAATTPATPTPKPSPQGGAGASTTTVQCDLDELSQQFRCTAQVADATGAAPSHTPTGSVSFALDPGAGGSFPLGTGCLLHPSDSGPTSFCSVQYQPGPDGVPTGTQPRLSGTYVGDGNFAPSTGRPTNRFGDSVATEVTPDATAITPQGTPTKTTSTSDASSDAGGSDCSGGSGSGSGGSVERAHIRIVNKPPDSFGPTTFIKIPARVIACKVPSGKPVPIDAEKAAKKAYDQGYAGSLTGSAATNGAVSSTLGSFSKIPGSPPQVAAVLSTVGDLFSVASGIETQVAKNATTRAADPPDPQFTHIARDPAFRVPAGAHLRLLPPALRRRVTVAEHQAATVAGLSAQATASINRAASAHTAHDAVWERRQMQAVARFSKQLAHALDRESAALTGLAGSALTKDLGARVLTADQVVSAARAVKAHGLPAALKRYARHLGLSARQQRDLRAQLAGASAEAGTSIAYRTLVTRSLKDTATVLRRYAASLSAYAAQVAENPVASNAS